MEYLQQGDVLLIKEALPSGLTTVKKDPVLQYGEATGHAHRLTSDDFELFEEPKTKTRYLKLLKPTVLKHEEHDPITLPPDTYRIDIIREVGDMEDEEYIRRVAD